VTRTGKRGSSTRQSTVGKRAKNYKKEGITGEKGDLLMEDTKEVRGDQNETLRNVGGVKGQEREEVGGRFTLGREKNGRTWL